MSVFLNLSTLEVAQTWTLRLRLGATVLVAVLAKEESAIVRRVRLMGSCC